MNAAETQEVTRISIGKLNVLDARMPSVGERLDGWKEIAAYLRRSVRCVQRWKKNERLPILRQRHAHGAAVYAFREELDDWWKDGGDVSQGAPRGLDSLGTKSGECSV